MFATFAAPNPTGNHLRLGALAIDMLAARSQRVLLRVHLLNFVHKSFGIDDDTVWATVTRDLLPLAPRLRELMADANGASSNGPRAPAESRPTARRPMPARPRTHVPRAGPTTAHNLEVDV